MKFETIRVWHNTKTGEVCLNMHEVFRSMLADVKHLHTVKPYMFCWKLKTYGVNMDGWR